MKFINSANLLKEFMFFVSTSLHGSQFLQSTLKKKSVIISQEHHEWYVKDEDITILLALSRL